MNASARASSAAVSSASGGLRFFATLWSLRGYPTEKREWSWPRKFAAIRKAGFEGVMSPPRTELHDRGELAYLAISSVARADQIAPLFAAIRELGAEGLVVQLGRPDTSLDACLKLARELAARGRECTVPVEFETHRNTFLETPERVAELAAAWSAEERGPLPVCYDFAHLAVVRHARAPFWPGFAAQREAIARARCLHLRPFNGHHCQIPVTFDGRRRTPEYRVWLEFAAEVFSALRAAGESGRIVVPELGHADPFYRLSCFPDTWTDTSIAHRDLRRLWQRSRAN